MWVAQQRLVYWLGAGTVSHAPVLYCTVLYCMVFYSNVLYCTVQYNKCRCRCRCSAPTDLLHQHPLQRLQWCIAAPAVLHAVKGRDVRGKVVATVTLHSTAQHSTPQHSLSMRLPQCSLGTRSGGGPPPPAARRREEGGKKAQPRERTSRDTAEQTTHLLIFLMRLPLCFLASPSPPPPPLYMLNWPRCKYGPPWPSEVSLPVDSDMVASDCTHAQEYCRWRPKCRHHHDALQAHLTYLFLLYLAV